MGVYNDLPSVCRNDSLSCFWKYSGSGGRENQAYDPGSEGKLFFWILLQIIFADSFWNMDMRSLMVDDEICGIFYSNELMKQYREIFEKDIFHCNPYTLEMFQGRTQKEKFMASIFLLFAPLM